MFGKKGSRSVPDDKRGTLSRYRLSRADETISAAEALIVQGYYLDAINRTYFAIFQLVRAVLALDGVDFKKHSAVISYFQREYVKTGKFNTAVSKYINAAFKIRNDSDYEDFFIVSRSDAMEQLSHAQAVRTAVAEYIKSL
jgi:uncharacterized protein (UPF0332 family)